MKRINLILIAILVIIYSFSTMKAEPLVTFSLVNRVAASNVYYADLQASVNPSNSWIVGPTSVIIEYNPLALNPIDFNGQSTLNFDSQLNSNDYYCKQTQYGSNSIQIQLITFNPNIIKFGTFIIGTFRWSITNGALLDNLSFLPDEMEVFNNLNWLYSDCNTINCFAVNNPIPQQIENYPLLLSPVLMSPLSSSLNLSVNPAFNWESVNNATNYTLQVSTNSLFSNIIMEETLQETSFTTSASLEYSTEYFWRVNASALGYTTSYWSDIWSFTTVADSINPVPSSWDYNSNTDNSAVIVIPYSINPTIGYRQLINGDAIGVFFTRNDSLICAGYSLWNGSNIGIVVWGNDVLTLEKEGFDVNEPFIFKIWDALAAEEFLATATYQSGPNEYFPNGYSVLASLNNASSHELFLNSGWNMISSYIIPQNPALETMFSPILQSIVLMKHGNGLFIPQWNINTLGSWYYKNAYQLSMNSFDTLNINGYQVYPENEPLTLIHGWNLSAYLRDNEMSPTTALSSISSSLVLAKDNAGGIYSPFYGINTLGNMQPSQGYYFYTNAAAMLTYPANSAQKAVVGNEITPLAKQLIPQFKNTGNSSTLLLEIDEVDNGNEIGVYNMNNELIGSGAVHNGVAAITIWGDDEITNEVDGALNDEFLTIKLLNSNNSFTNLSLYNLREITGNTELDNLAYRTDAIYTAKAALPQENSFSFSISSIPNPTSSNTNFEFYLTDESEAEIKIYTLTGELVAKIENSNYTAGIHRVNFNASQLSNGVYNVILHSGNQRAMTMMVIEK